MKPKSLMFIAGEPSGDMHAADLVLALREQLPAAEADANSDAQPLHAGLAPRFFGAGGPRMAAAGVELAFDMTRYSTIGLSGVLKGYLRFRRLFEQLYRMALERQPDAIICVDFGIFNLRFAQAISAHARGRRGWFHDWKPKLIQYVSPQVWASREGRADKIARDYDLLLSIFPFEKEWYASRVPRLPVVFVGNPIVDRPILGAAESPTSPLVLLLPGSRKGELKRHLPVLRGTVEIMRSRVPGLRMRMVLPDEALATRAKAAGLPADIIVEAGGLAEAMVQATLAIASTGTVTMECAAAGLPVVALYKTSWFNYPFAKLLAKVEYVAMPNILANQPVFPEFIQAAATPSSIAAAALELLNDGQRRKEIRGKLSEIVASLGAPGASRRAAAAIVSLLVEQGATAGRSA